MYHCKTQMVQTHQLLKYQVWWLLHVSLFKDILYVWWADRTAESQQCLSDYLWFRLRWEK